MTADVTSSSSGAGSDKPEIPIARNSNPAGVSTARAAEIPMRVEQESPESPTEATQENPVARNSNPAGVSTSRTRE
jgi:hypothetical protein